MTYKELAKDIVARWDMSGRISIMGRAIVLSSNEIAMLVIACNGADALRSLDLTSALRSPQDRETPHE